ncbi:Adenosine monophosphate-protein transferase NmFic [Corynebacterium kalinowskii]|uniref:protein adenylyltransferase n=1 Tax=Corynebacterium kalinowskii TaxID=2675216 RepID=A0A6B8VGH7_9CORY|nr:Fic family protein [Corynebacterium kalinowskii]QGU03253.1 Adenosine monophosphate-protein transferase NmFic [Corynebacterium kalinowskii]
MPNNLLGLTDGVALAREEERLTKIRAVELFDRELLNEHTPGTFECLRFIHQHLFQDVYSFAGEIRSVDISKGGFRFASVFYLPAALDAIDAMPQSSFDEIIAKYVEMNIAHPFHEGNGRSTRIWLDHVLVQSLRRTVDWSLVDKQDYLLAMERSPVKDLEIRSLLGAALTGGVPDRAAFLEGIDASYRYEGFGTYRAVDLGK